MLVLILDNMFLDVMTSWIISPKLKLFQINAPNNLYFIILIFLRLFSINN